MSPASGVRWRTGLLVVGILLVAANMRAAITVVGPLLGQVRSDLHLSAATGSALISLPLLAFAACSPFAPRLARRFGMERALGGALVLLVVGILTRSVSWIPALWIGTAVLGMAIAIMNTVLPGLLKRDFPRDVGRLTGAYSATMSCAAAAASGFAVPLAGTDENHWRLAFGVWSGLAVVAFAVFFPQLRRRSRPTPPTEQTDLDPAGEHPGRSPWRTPLAWQVTLFMGTQSTAWYIILTWWPSIEGTKGISIAGAGFHQGLVQIASIVGNLACAAWIQKAPKDQRTIAAVLVPLPAVAILGELAWPVGAIFWNLLLGLGTGGVLVLALALFGLRSRHHQQAAALSGMAQSVGYLLAAAGPVAVGLLHDRTASWAWPLGVLFALMAVELGAGLLATRPRLLD